MPKMGKGGPEVAWEAFLLGADWRGGLPEDPVWCSWRNGIGDSLPMVFCQRLPKGVHQGDTVLEVEVHCGEEFRLEGGADATGFGISGSHRVGGVIWSEGS